MLFQDLPTNTTVTTTDGIDLSGNAGTVVNRLNSLSCGCYGWCSCPANYHITTWWPSTSKVSLKASEVQYLRKQAKRDKRLRAILKKMAPHIEVDIDF